MSARPKYVAMVSLNVPFESRRAMLKFCDAWSNGKPVPTCDRLPSSEILIYKSRRASKKAAKPTGNELPR
jgi:hypothetical protein